MVYVNYNMNINIQQKIIKNYFKFFNEKNINKILNIFLNKISLKDWNIDVRGKLSVISANKKIFKSNPKIKVKVKKIYFIRENIFAILDIRLNYKNKISVIDHFTINKKYLISKIRAYLG